MKIVKRLKIEDKPGYYFTDITGINNFDLKLIFINEFTIFKNGSAMFDISYCEESNATYCF